MNVCVDNKDKMTSYQWGYDEESKRYFVKINFDVPSDTKVNVLSFSDYTKQVRKEVCEEIKNKILKDEQVWRYPEYEKSDVIELVLDIIEESLDQIIGESK